MSLNPESKEFNPNLNSNSNSINSQPYYGAPMVYGPQDSNVQGLTMAQQLQAYYSYNQSQSNIQNNNIQTNIQIQSNIQKTPNNARLSKENSGGNQEQKTTGFGSKSLDSITNAQPFVPTIKLDSPSSYDNSSNQGFQGNQKNTSFNPMAREFTPSVQIPNGKQNVPTRNVTPTPQAFQNNTLQNSSNGIGNVKGLNSNVQAFNPSISSIPSISSMTPMSSIPSMSFTQPQSSNNSFPKIINPSTNNFVPSNQQSLKYSKQKNVRFKPFFPQFDNQNMLMTQIKEDNKDYKGTVKSLFMNQNLRHFFLNKLSFKHQIPVQHIQPFPFIIPLEVNITKTNYHSLFPLFQKYENSSVLPPYQFGIYKAVEQENDEMVTIVHVKDSQGIPNQTLAQYQVLNHPNIVRLRNFFTSTAFFQDKKAFDTNTYIPSKLDNILVYDYVDYGESLYQIYIIQKILSLPSESEIWSFICQIFCALDAIHSNNLYYGCMSLRKILLSPQLKRIHLSSIGTHSLLQSKERLEIMQAQDIRGVAHIIIQLMNGNENEIINIESTLFKLKSKNYSKELIEFLEKLGTETITVKEIIQNHLGLHLMKELTNLHDCYNTLENETLKEIENGRLFRLLVKLNFIIQKNENDSHPYRWTEEGDLYVLRLFFDHLFQFQIRDGISQINWVHVLENLNKLDSGVEHCINLASKDNLNILMVSYRELRECFQNVYNELTSQ